MGRGFEEAHNAWRIEKLRTAKWPTIPPPKPPTTPMTMGAIGNNGKVYIAPGETVEIVFNDDGVKLYSPTLASSSLHAPRVLK